jgi:uncharacterized protein
MNDIAGVSKLGVASDRIAEFCREHHIRKLALFGSVLRDDFGPESDVDVLVEFEEGRPVGLVDLAAMEMELEQVLGRKVDLVTFRSVEQSRNYIRRRRILDSQQTIYVA